MCRQLWLRPSFQKNKSLRRCFVWKPKIYPYVSSHGIKHPFFWHFCLYNPATARVSCYFWKISCISIRNPSHCPFLSPNVPKTPFHDVENIGYLGQSCSFCDNSKIPLSFHSLNSYINFLSHTIFYSWHDLILVTKKPAQNSDDFKKSHEMQNDHCDWSRCTNIISPNEELMLKHLESDFK